MDFDKIEYIIDNSQFDYMIGAKSRPRPGRTVSPSHETPSYVDPSPASVHHRTPHATPTIHTPVPMVMSTPYGNTPVNNSWLGTTGGRTPISRTPHSGAHTPHSTGSRTPTFNTPRSGSRTPSGSHTPHSTGGHTPQSGSYTPHTGGHTPHTGGHTPRTGGHTPRTGGHTPRTGGHTPRTGGHTPRTGGHTPRIGSHTPRIGSHTPHSAGGDTPRDGSTTPNEGGRTPSSKTPRSQRTPQYGQFADQGIKLKTATSPPASAVPPSSAALPQAAPQADVAYAYAQQVYLQRQTQSNTQKPSVDAPVFAKPAPPAAPPATASGQDWAKMAASWAAKNKTGN